MDPNLQLARYVLASVHSLFGRKENCIEEAHKAVALNPHTASVVSGCGFLLAMMGEWEDGLALMYDGKRLNPHYPSWYHFVPFMYHYQWGDYQDAWTEAQLMQVPGLYWHPLIRAAVLGQLGRVHEAHGHLQEPLQIKPDFPERGREIMKRLIVLDENAEMLWDGLGIAGLEQVG